MQVVEPPKRRLADDSWLASEEVKVQTLSLSHTAHAMQSRPPGLQEHCSLAPEHAQTLLEKP